MKFRKDEKWHPFINFLITAVKWTNYPQSQLHIKSTTLETERQPISSTNSGHQIVADFLHNESFKVRTKRSQKSVSNHQKDH